MWLCQRRDCRQVTECLAPFDGITHMQPLWLLTGDDGVNMSRSHTELPRALDLRRTKAEVRVAPGIAPTWPDDRESHPMNGTATDRSWTGTVATERTLVHVQGQWAVRYGPLRATSAANEEAGVNLNGHQRQIRMGSSVPGFRLLIILSSVLIAGTLGILVPQPAEAGVATPSLTTVPSPSVGFVLSISCVTARDCMAVGWLGTGPTGSAPLAESWDGAAWSILPIPNPNTISFYTSQLY